jgi:hypothetical protein
MAGSDANDPVARMRHTGKAEGEEEIRRRAVGEPPVSPTVIFLHIGKTAGSTLRQVIRRNYRSADILKAQRPGGPREATLEDFARIPESRRAVARLVMGHTIFGVHELVPGPSTYVTVVREPVKLVLSQYRFVLRRPYHRFHQRVTSQGMGLADYIRSGMSIEVDNGQTRAIAGDTSTPFGQCTEEMLRRAKRNIEEYFSVAGLTERFDETLLLFREALGWTHLCYVRANVSPDRSSSNLPTEAAALIEEHTALDRELYGFVRQRFEAALAEVPDFDRKLHRFRRMNALYRPWGLLTQALPKQMILKIRGKESAVGPTARPQKP